MKVLLLSLHHPELIRGGAQQVAYELFQGLQRRDDVEPTLLCAIDPNFPAFYKSGARIVGFDGRKNEFLFLTRGYNYLWHRLGDLHLVQAYAEFLALLRPDVVHFHHFLLFGFELLSVTRRVLPKARIVFTLHEFLTICDANGHMVRKSDGSLCDHASSARCHQCFPERGPEQFFMRELWVKEHLSQVDAFTTPTRFMIERFVDWGLPRERMHFVTNGQRDYSAGVRSVEARRKRNRFGFFGQMIDAKGIQILFRAVAQLRAAGFTDFTVEINGDNLKYATQACRTELEAFIAEETARPYGERRVVVNGSYNVDQLPQRMARVDWCIMPSIWWEAFGLVISEAWMFGRPVICSNIGAMAERVRDDVDGLHFSVADPSSLAETMMRAATEAGLWERLAKAIRPPPPREAMVEGFVGVYEGRAVAPPPPARARGVEREAGPGARELVFGK
jgi:glycosyltransferase involved in cell wall biosynthesis